MRLAATLALTVVLAFFFAQFEIQVEGGAGWATSLPTWRIESHWLLDLFWGGRAMTGYHAWVFPFIGMIFHFPMVMFGQWSWRLQARTFAIIMVFWLCEDLMWFALNPAWGFARFRPEEVFWHKHWFAGMPVDYWLFSVLAAVLLYVSRDALERINARSEVQPQTAK